MNVKEYAREILEECLSSKLLIVPKCDDIFQKIYDLQVSFNSGREKRIDFSSKQLKFPKVSSLESEKRSMALHFFANHELAIEMMAAFILVYPDVMKTMKLKREFWQV